MSQVRGDAGVVMTEAESRRAAVRDDRQMGLAAWKAVARQLGMGLDYRLCGAPLVGGIYRRYEPRAGVWNVAHGAVSSCNYQWCPRCGLEQWLRRWALLVLSSADWVRQGGFLCFLSVAGQHGADEPFAAKHERWRWFTDFFPGKGDSPGKKFMRQNGIHRFVR